MNTNVTDLPSELVAELLRFLREVNGEITVADTQGLLRFIVEHGVQYPVLFNLLEVNRGAIVEHFERTGTVPPGVRLSRTTTPEISGECEYMDQYKRMKRSYATFADIDRGRIHDRASESYDDEVFAFFLNCYHLKDWIKNDGSVGLAAQNSVESFINTSHPLKLCADICNAHKHLKLKSPRSNENPRFGKKHYAFLGDVAATTISVKYEIETSTGTVDAFTLATQCIDEWESFIRSKCEHCTWL